MSEGISYQNKDIEFKLLSESFKERSFEAYGLKSDRFISRKNTESIRRWLGMTKVFQIFEEEKQKALREKDKKSAKTLLKNDVDIKIILEATDLTEEEIKKIQESILGLAE